MAIWTPGERAQLAEGWAEKVAAIRKLEKIVDQVKARAQAESWQTEGEYADPTEYGFYIKYGGKYLLWIGIWTVAPTPISYGFDRKWVEREPSIQAIVGKEDKLVDRWLLFSLPDQSWLDPSKVWTAIEPKLERIRSTIS